MRLWRGEEERERDKPACTSESPAARDPEAAAECPIADENG